MKAVKKGEVVYFTIFFIIAVNLLLAFLLFTCRMQIQLSDIRGGVKMQLNNLSASIASDTYAALRESNLDGYMAQLYSSNSYHQKLTDDFKDGLAQKIRLKTNDYELKHIRLAFYKESGRVKYEFSCDAQLRVHLFNRDYPPINRSITLSGYHNFKVE